ncbi:MAG: hypothetical protein IJS04_03550 [Muribaculaceae bacterium]|jgi:hypothetical protein|nr:hypothetical protein [Muribaculaceae bacterium]MBQ7204900.1 hypothetical protein [Muribaculaceae bacterium]
MKKIFTLLFCVAAMALAANAETSRAQECINYLLYGSDAPKAAMVAEFDVNNDGVVDICDATMMINMDIQARAQAKAPAKNKVDVDAIINDILDDVPPTPNLGDVNTAISKNLEE